MIFLIEYDRPSGKTLRFIPFEESERASAERSRLDIELVLNSKGVEHEVVLLEAASESALRRTHRRYFESLGDLAGPADNGKGPH